MLPTGILLGISPKFYHHSWFLKFLLNIFSIQFKFNYFKNAFWDSESPRYFFRESSGIFSQAPTGCFTEILLPEFLPRFLTEFLCKKSHKIFFREFSTNSHGIPPVKLPRSPQEMPSWILQKKIFWKYSRDFFRDYSRFFFRNCQDFFSYFLCDFFFSESLPKIPLTHFVWNVSWKLC